MALRSLLPSGLLAIGLAACARREAPKPIEPSALAPKPTEPSALAPKPAPVTAELASAAAPATTPPASALPGASAPDRALPPLAASEQFVPLEVPGFEPAVVSVPTGAAAPRPIAVALHGNFDRPEWQCEVWRGVLGTRGFILCPRGIPRRDVPKREDRWEYGSAKAVEAEIEAGVSALKQRFPGHVADGPLLLIGFSLGAIYGAPIALKRPQRFPKLVLVEGGQRALAPGVAKKFAAAAGEPARLFIACGQANCLLSAKQLSLSLERAGLPTRFGGAPKAGHTYDGEVAAAVSRELGWLLAGDLRWGE